MNDPQRTPSYESSSQGSIVYAFAVISGTQYAVMKCSVELYAHGASNTAELVLPLQASPDFTTMFQGIAWVAVQVYVSITPASAASTKSNAVTGSIQLFSGSIDLNSMAFHDDTITIKCRSLASLLIDNRITGLPRNMKTTDLVTALATQYNLTASISLLDGQYVPTVAELYAHDFAVGIQNDRIWDVLMKAAEFDGTDVWVVGSTLFYAVPSKIARAIVDIKYGRDIETLTAEHSTASKAIRVEVRIYNHRTRSAAIQRWEVGNDGTTDVTTSARLVTSDPVWGTKNTTTYSISSTGVQSTVQSTIGGGTQNTQEARGPDNPNGALIYKFYKPGWSLEAANQFAQATLLRLQMQEYTVTMRVPITASKAMGLSSITSQIRLHGVPMNVVNDTYWPRRITWNIDMDNPCIDIEAVNIALPAGQV